jgi:hypothetical protein
MSPHEEIVFVEDDDVRVREAVGELLESLDEHLESAGHPARGVTSDGSFSLEGRRGPRHGPSR